ncbi:MAG: hypothetical protein WBJ54_01365, partial [Syntrophorhabdus sp.]
IKGGLMPLWVDKLIKEQKATGLLNKEYIELNGTKVVPYDLTLKLWRQSHKIGIKDLPPQV